MWEQTTLMKEIFFGNHSESDLAAAAFVPTLEGAQDLTLPLSGCVKVQTHVTQMWDVSCGDSWLENKALSHMV